MMFHSKHKSFLIKIFVVLLLVGAAYLYMANRVSAPEGEGGNTNLVGPDYKNATYVIDGRQVTLVGGKAETEFVLGSASKLITQFFGNEATGDVNGDGVPDVAFLLTRSGGGSGTFFYIVAALKTTDGYTGTNAILLGDRVAPQPTTITNGIVIANYADRKPGEPMTTQPSVGVSKYLHVVDGSLVEGSE